MFSRHCHQPLEPGLSKFLWMSRVAEPNVCTTGDWMTNTPKIYEPCKFLWLRGETNQNAQQKKRFHKKLHFKLASNGLSVIQLYGWPWWWKGTLENPQSLSCSGIPSKSKTTGPQHHRMDVSKNRGGPPKWMVYNGKHWKTLRAY